MGGEDDELNDELGFNDGRNEGEHYEDVRYGKFAENQNKNYI